MSETTIADEPQYQTFLEDVRSRIQRTQVSVVKSASRELIGAELVASADDRGKQEAPGWGKSVVEQLAADLRTDAEAWRGFSAQNLWYMRQIYIAYRQNTILQQLVGES